MKAKPRENRKWVVRYEPLQDGIEEEIQQGVQGEFDTPEEAHDAARQCDLWFNRPTRLAYEEHAETGRPVPIKRQLKLRNVRIWIDEEVDGEKVEGEPCEVVSEEAGGKRGTKSSKVAEPVG